jgi:hypothetical protein
LGGASGAEYRNAMRATLLVVRVSGKKEGC